MITLNSSNRVITKNRIAKGQLLGKLKGLIVTRQEIRVVKKEYIPFVNQGIELFFMPIQDETPSSYLSYVKKGKKPNVAVKLIHYEEDIGGIPIQIPELFLYAIRNIRLDEDLRRFY